MPARKQWATRSYPVGPGNARHGRLVLFKGTGKNGRYPKDDGCLHSFRFHEFGGPEHCQKQSADPGFFRQTAQRGQRTKYPKGHESIEEVRIKLNCPVAGFFVRFLILAEGQ